MIFAVFVYSKFTSLGDYDRYINSTQNFSMLILDSTPFVDFSGNIAGSIFGRNFLANLPFICLSFYGVYYPVKKIVLSDDRLISLLLILSFPSFGVWTSVLGKESYCVFAVGLVLGYFIDLLSGYKRLPTFMELFGIFLVYRFKPQYIIAMAHVFVFAFLRSRRSKPGLILFVFILFIAIDISTFYYFREVISDLSLMMHTHFSSSLTSRGNTLQEEYDVFIQAPYGMLLAFIGPTLSESIHRLVFLPTLIESIVMLAILIYGIWKGGVNRLIYGRINITFISVIFFAFFWFLFVHYPFGFFNPGSAVRYRSGFQHFLIILVFYFSNKGRYVQLSVK